MERALAKDVDILIAALAAVGRQHGLRDPLASLGPDGIGLTPPQLHALAWLGEDGPLPMSTLARRVGIGDAAATGLVDRLVAQGSVTRAPSPTDRRVVLVTLTKEGARLADDIRRSIRERLTQFLGLLSERDRRSLLRIIENMTKSTATTAERNV